jgi:hypothetical protein
VKKKQRIPRYPHLAREISVPDYGVVVVSEKQYKCDNGKVYNEAEFQMYYDAPVNKQDN